jgi:hypothetical protein
MAGLLASVAALQGACSGGGDNGGAPPLGGAPGNAASQPAASGSGGTSRTGNVDACALVTREEAAAALGQAVLPGDKTPEGCNYVSEGDSGSKVVYIQVSAPNRAKQTFDFARQAFKDTKPVAGVGDEAFVLELGAPVAQVHFRKGDVYITVVVSNYSINDRVARATELAKKAASRL